MRTELNSQEAFLEDKLTVMGLKECVGHGWEHRKKENFPGTILGILWEGPLNTYCVLSLVGRSMGEEKEAGNTTVSS